MRTAARHNAGLRRCLLGAALLAAVLFVGPGPVSTAAAPPAGSDTAGFAKSSNAFGLDLYRRLKDGPGNRVFSPASITVGLAMASGGARGETAAEMRRVLRIEGTPAEVMQASGKLAAALQDRSQPVTLRIANRLFGERGYPLDPAFIEATRTAYGAPLERVDFKGAPESARVHINAWVSAQTEQRIANLIPSGRLARDTRLVLVNAIYFLGDWQESFAAEATRPVPFHTSSTAKKDVPTMHRTGQLRLAQRNGWKALELPYVGGKLAMLVLLPDALDGLAALESALTVEQIDEVVSALGTTLVAVALPRFEVNPTLAFPLGGVLRTMGMSRAFSPTQADFSGIANPPDPGDGLVIGEVFHKAFVKVDEKGTEAAAATAIGMVTRGFPAPRPREFTADRPFLFLVRDTASGLILFMGRVSDPARS